MVLIVVGVELEAGCASAVAVVSLANMLMNHSTVLLLLVSLPPLVKCGVPHSHGVKKGHAEREEDGSYRYV